MLSFHVYSRLFGFGRTRRSAPTMCCHVEKSAMQRCQCRGRPMCLPCTRIPRPSIRCDSSDTDIPFHIGRQDGEAVPRLITAVWREASPAEPIPIRTTTPKVVELFPLQFRADTPIRPYIVIGIWSTRPNQVNKRGCVSGVWRVDSYVRHRNFYNRHRKN